MKVINNISFDSASTAAAVISGLSQNGRVAWKNKDGKTQQDFFEYEQPQVLPNYQEIVKR